MSTFPGRVALQQRVLPAYRAAFFDALASVCEGGLSVFAGQPREDEAISVTDQLQVAKHAPARNWHLFSGSYYLCLQRGWRAWLEDWNPAALIVEANPRYLSTPGAVRLMHTRGCPVIGWGLGAPPHSGLLAGMRSARRLKFLDSFDAIIAYSQRGAQEYRAQGVPEEKLFVAHNAVMAAPVGPPPVRPAGFEGRPTVLFVGRLQARKRIDVLLQACAALPESLQPRLLIVGDGPERVALETLAQEVYAAAQFLGARQGAELDEIYALADLFVLPGTGGLAVQQAMSRGLPVVVGRGDGTQEDLVRSGNGWLLPPDDLHAFTRALQEALSEPARLRAMGLESYRIAREEINIDRMVERFVEVLLWATNGKETGVRR